MYQMLEKEEDNQLEIDSVMLSCKGHFVFRRLWLSLVTANNSLNNAKIIQLLIQAIPILYVYYSLYILPALEILLMKLSQFYGLRHFATLNYWFEIFLLNQDT